ncbi:hypothetical protein DFS33DRAFT_1386855 [Desarmillaria ectypa]|nr:hypothetical protein DFS33DRAFT_1386855 [Desarmillaria ectypa]
MVKDPSLSDRDMSPLTDVDTESYASEEDTEDEGRTSLGKKSDENEAMIKMGRSDKMHRSAEELSQQRHNCRLDAQTTEDNHLESAIFHEVSACSSGSNVPIGNSNTGRHPSEKSKTTERISCSTGENLPSSCAGVPQKKKIRDIKLYMQEEQCHALLDEPDDVIFSARAMPSEEYEQLLFLEYQWLEQRVHKQSTFPGLLSLKVPLFDTACSKCRRDNIRCEARAIGACIDDYSGRNKYYGLSCKYCLASNKRGCDAWMHCWDVPYPLWSSRNKPDSVLKHTEGQLIVEEDVRDKVRPDKQESTIATASPMSSTAYSNLPLFLDLRTKYGVEIGIDSDTEKDSYLNQPDDIVFSARAMSYHAYKRLLLLEYPWLEVAEAKCSIGDRAPSLKHWSLKAPVFDDAER